MLKSQTMAEIGSIWVHWIGHIQFLICRILVDLEPFTSFHSTYYRFLSGTLTTRFPRLKNKKRLNFVDLNKTVFQSVWLVKKCKFTFLGEALEATLFARLRPGLSASLRSCIIMLSWTASPLSTGDNWAENYSNISRPKQQ